MKYFIVVVFAVAACVGLELPQQVIEHAEVCGKENNVDITIFKGGKKPDMKIFENRDYRCFAKCMFIKSEFVMENGEPNIEKVKQTFQPTDEMMAQMKQCSEENKQSDICDKVYETQDCIMKKIPIN